MCRDYYTLQFMDPSVDTAPIAPALRAFFDDVLEASVSEVGPDWSPGYYLVGWLLAGSVGHLVGQSADRSVERLAGQLVAWEGPIGASRATQG
jgi:hypothetical protein